MSMEDSRAMMKSGAFMDCVMRLSRMPGALDGPSPPWGQHLLLFEILALMQPYPAACLPFECAVLARALRALGKRVYPDMAQIKAKGLAFATYVGTPTVLMGKPLFPDEVRSFEWPVTLPSKWTVETDRQYIRGLCETAGIFGCKRIVTGLGSGDVSVGDRLEDMGADARVVCVKHFEGFTDWVVARDL